MLAKLTSKNQLTLPKSVTDQLGPVQYFEVQLQAGQVLLTPVRIQRGDAVRAKLAELELGDEVVAQAIAFASKAAKAAVKPAAKRATRKPTRSA
ncbi:AbrB/MazE/SpoVT family DNA-binding domain-containing protein [Roseateles sp.]|uniref:AbrB/MazE/SpoVT family DNA-binding domain-containing protein n=1 Tax=Roseateles sp. TaxID=1971397 RepID=UPI0031D7EFEB